MSFIKFFTSPKETTNAYLKAKKEKERQLEFEVKRASVIHALTTDLTSRESIQMYEEVSAVYKRTMTARLDSITWEKKAIEEFFNTQL